MPSAHLDEQHALPQTFLLTVLIYNSAEYNALTHFAQYPHIHIACVAFPISLMHFPSPLAPPTPAKCAEGSPSGCSVTNIPLNGAYSAGRLIKVVDGHRVKKSTDKDSCPLGWKIFSPRSREDVITVVKSVGTGTGLPRDPFLIVDITRHRAGFHSRHTKFPMNSEVVQVSSWVTQDRSPWWLRDDPFKEPSGDYHPDCYMNIVSVNDKGDVNFNDSK